MFSYSGLNKAQMLRLRSEFGVYGVDSGRICVAALNSGTSTTLRWDGRPSCKALSAGIWHLKVRRIGRF